MEEGGRCRSFLRWFLRARASSALLRKMVLEFGEVDEAEFEEEESDETSGTAIPLDITFTTHGRDVNSSGETRKSRSTS